MPIYEYKCESCGNEFEELMKINAPAPPCPACGGEDVGRLVSRTSFVLKGGGWYKDGYTGKSNQRGGGGSSDSSGTTASSSSSSASSTSSSSSD